MRLAVLLAEASDLVVDDSRNYSKNGANDHEVEVVDCDEITIAFTAFLPALKLWCWSSRRGNCRGSEVEEFEAVAYAHAL